MRIDNLLKMNNCIVAVAVSILLSIIIVKLITIIVYLYVVLARIMEIAISLAVFPTECP